RLKYVAVINLLLAPFIVMFMLVYFFFGYFEVYNSTWRACLISVGILYESRRNWCSAFYAIGTVEVPRIQRAGASVPNTSTKRTSSRDALPKPVSQREDPHRCPVLGVAFEFVNFF